MCIAIVNPKGTEVSEEHLSNSWENNYNGAGFSYNNDKGNIVYVKEMKKFETFYRKYKKARDKFPNATFLIHFRISTHGVITKENCHPFKINNEMAFIHNGMISNVDKHNRYSDTNMFNRHVLRKIAGLDIKMLKSAGMQSLIDEFIGYSKMAFMDNKGNYAIIGEDKGTGTKQAHWLDGVWYSNDSYSYVSEYIDYGGQKKKKDSINEDVWNDDDFYGHGHGIGYSRYGSLYSGWNGSSFDDAIGEKTKGSESFSFSADNAGYSIVGGDDEICTTCQIQMYDGELTNEYGECMQCVSDVEANLIIKAAEDDGCILSGAKYFPEVIGFDEEKRRENKEKKDAVAYQSTCECVMCGTVKYASEMYQTHLMNSAKFCAKCFNGFVDDGYLPGEDRILEIVK